jgi:hypothetical protein
MKKCPTCDKEFPDSMRFCQTDGTVLVDAAPPADPYKTTVASQDEIASSIPPLDPFKTMVASPPPKPAENDLLQLPEESDQLKTVVVSQDEMREESKSSDASPLDLPPAPPIAPSAPLIEPKPPSAPGDFSSPPKSNEPSLNPPSFGDLGQESSFPKPSAAIPGGSPKDSGAPPSPFDAKPFENDFSSQSPYGNQENKPIPSPFDGSMIGYQPPVAPTSGSPFDAPKPPPFKEPEPQQQASPNQSPFQTPSPFDAPEPFNPPMEQSGWAPPPAPVSEWGNQNLGANTPFQPPPAATGQDQTLAIVSLVCGILGILCCGILTGIPAIITGFMAKNNADSNPEQYGGRGMALAGMILGGISVVLTIVVIVLQVLLGGFGRF